MGKNVTVDLRKLHDSGIGTYLRAIVPRVAASMPDVCFRVLGDALALERLEWTRLSNIKVRNCGVPPLSLQEQWQMPRYLPRHNDLLWMTHLISHCSIEGKCW